MKHIVHVSDDSFGSFFNYYISGEYIDANLHENRKAQKFHFIAKMISWNLNLTAVHLVWLRCTSMFSVYHMHDLWASLLSSSFQSDVNRTQFIHSLSLSSHCTRNTCSRLTALCESGIFVYPSKTYLTVIFDSEYFIYARCEWTAYSLILWRKSKFFCLIRMHWCIAATIYGRLTL